MQSPPQSPLTQRVARGSEKCVRCDATCTVTQQKTCFAPIRVGFAVSMRAHTNASAFSCDTRRTRQKETRTDGDEEGTGTCVHGCRSNLRRTMPTNADRGRRPKIFSLRSASAHFNFTFNPATLGRVSSPQRSILQL
ncbi:hypothetical protein PLICRDRAFT_347936 [Plicaturopsis crispa FD-325 SS-3]|uniref:Unplaced genomic scaffold PLICRscaffold_16, whole genome shotgun sequence n=1 Tax=Plicaturopsis crispa FD-325 SS-3 TaxID=944288 RepID=A0A0C9T9J5_PLICR|nr:hypothetical protein PLICRDRAFT_347936 [Plicaturopsis crispa FD-325 SS-3]